MTFQIFQIIDVFIIDLGCHVPNSEKQFKFPSGRKRVIQSMSYWVDYEYIST